MERLNKYLARAGVASRRACDDLILAGRVKINDAVMRELGTKIDPDHDTVSVDDSRVKPQKEAYWVVNKPPGYLCTNHDPAGRPLALDLVTHVDQRVFTVGRLDEGSEGMLILTNDGDLAAGLMHPRYGIEKGYEVLVAGFPTREDLVSLTEGVWLAEGRVQAKSVKRWKRQGDGTWLRIVLCEGKNREIRRMLARLSHKVMRLRRTSIGPIKLDGMPLGKSRKLLPAELEELRDAVERQKARRGLENEPEREYELIDVNDVIGDEPEFSESVVEDEILDDSDDSDEMAAPDDSEVAEALAFAARQGGGEDEDLDDDEEALLSGLDDDDEDEDGDLLDEDGDELMDDEDGGMDDQDESPAPKKKPFQPRVSADRPAPRPWQQNARSGEGDSRGGQSWSPNRGGERPSERPRGGNFGARPQGNFGSRPQGDRPRYQGDRPRFDGPPRALRPDGNFGPRPPRPEGNFGPRPQGDRPRFDGPPRPPRPQGDRPQFNGPPRAPRPEGNFGPPRGPRPQGDRPSYQGDRPRFDGPPRGPRPDSNFGPRPPRPEGNFGPRPQGDRPRFDGPPRSPRPQGDRPRYLGDRPRFDGPRPPRPEGHFGPPRGPRPQGDRPRYQGDRPQGDRPRFDGPPRGDRPQGDRPRYQGDRPQGDRPRFEGPRPPRPSHGGMRPQYGPPRPKRPGMPLGKMMRRKPDGK